MARKVFKNELMTEYDTVKVLYKKWDYFKPIFENLDFKTLRTQYRQIQNTKFYTFRLESETIGSWRWKSKLRDIQMKSTWIADRLREMLYD